VLDARPSDSIALALRANAPIYLAKKVIEEAGIEMKDEEIPGESIAREKISQLPKTQLEILQESLNNALRTEDYETAARIRDQIKKLIENS
ncbi:bifunctional nuclease family protein, partial [Leptospira borgpetersenii serovar Hardjo-bovis]|nr:bifunctional nuclease family protein [Leptospira borgpetersenii serovar Hardjo-bovis]